MLKIKHCVNPDRESSKNQIVHLIQHIFVNSLTAEHVPKAKPELGQHELNILVKHIDDQKCIASVRLTAMDKHQWDQV